MRGCCGDSGQVGDRADWALCASTSRSAEMSARVPGPGSVRSGQGATSFDARIGGAVVLPAVRVGRRA